MKPTRPVRPHPASREKSIAATSAIGITVNLLLAAFKVTLGVLASSIAIVSEGANNATDALSSVLTLIGTKLAGRHPDRRHPFGYRRVEYLTGLVVALLILATGLEMLTGSVKRVFRPEDVSVSYMLVLLIVLSAVVKFWLGLYTIRKGRQTGSSALTAVGIESRNDAFASVITVASALTFLWFHLSVDAYAGLIISALILKAGWDVLKNTLSTLIGPSGEKELAERLYREIRGTEGIIAASDMVLHNYGPDIWSGSVNVEIDHKRTVGEVYRLFHPLQQKIRRQYAVALVFGLYAVDNDHAEIAAIRAMIDRFVQNHPHIQSFHAVYFDTGADTLYCDLVVDYDVKDWEGLKEEFIGFVHASYPSCTVALTVETEYV